MVLSIAGTAGIVEEIRIAGGSPDYSILILTA
jgi:hypothetical protein